MKRTFSAILIAGAVFALGTAAYAADDGKPATHTVTLRSGKVLQDAYILDKKPNGITVAYKDGAMFIPFSDMPLDYQQKFGYDPIKSARYEKKLYEQKKIAEKAPEFLLGYPDDLSKNNQIKIRRQNGPRHFVDVHRNDGQQD